MKVLQYHSRIESGKAQDGGLNGMCLGGRESKGSNELVVYFVDVWIKHLNVQSTM